MMRPGDYIYFNDGQLNAQVTDVEIDEIRIEFRSSGKIPSYGAVKLTGSKYGQLPLLKKEDFDDIKDFAVRYRFDYICLPCTQTGKDVQEVKLSIGEASRRISILAKIDTLEAVQQYEGILKEADGVILLRNELAFELEAQKQVIAQKWMINRANQEAKPVFIQSQVLESLIDKD